MARKKSTRIDPPEPAEQFPRRRAGLRPDERDPEEPSGEPGSGAGSIHAAGTPGGGLAAGGLGGTNTGTGSVDEDRETLEEGYGSGIYDNSGDTVDEEVPYAGPSGGAVGGTPAGKRASGGKTHRGIAPRTGGGGDPTIGTDPRGHGD